MEVHGAHEAVVCHPIPDPPVGVASKEPVIERFGLPPAQDVLLCQGHVGVNDRHHTAVLHPPLQDACATPRPMSEFYSQFCKDCLSMPLCFCATSRPTY